MKCPHTPSFNQKRLNGCAYCRYERKIDEGCEFCGKQNCIGSVGSCEGLSKPPE
ncbi:MAG: hypothetical protein Q8O88_00820 [bacterium]|nr:hypothetical protein [bacterium]